MLDLEGITPMMVSLGRDESRQPIIKKIIDAAERGSLEDQRLLDCLYDLQAFGYNWVDSIELKDGQYNIAASVSLYGQIRDFKASLDGWADAMKCWWPLRKKELNTEPKPRLTVTPTLVAELEARLE